MIAFIILTKTEFYQYYANEPQKCEDQEQLIELNPESGETELLPLISGVSTKISTFAIGKQIWIWILSVFICFFGTLAVTPSITVLVRSTSSGNTWSDTFFIPIGCFLLFNVGDYGGRILAGLNKFNWATRFGSLCLLVLSLMKLAFIPLFLYCNAAPFNRHRTHVAIHSDTAYLIFMVFFSVSNGYIGSIAMMYGPKMLQSAENQGRAASLLVSFLVSGLALGAFTSQLLVALL